MNEEEIILIEDETEEEIVVMNEDVAIDPTIPDYVRNLTKEDINKLSVIDNTGNGDEYLSNDGTYKKMIDIGGTSDYTELKNKPSINDMELNGNKTLEELGIPLKTSELENDSNFINVISLEGKDDKTNPWVIEEGKFYSPIESGWGAYFRMSTENENVYHKISARGKGILSAYVNGTYGYLFYIGFNANLVMKSFTFNKSDDNYEVSNTNEFINLKHLVSRYNPAEINSTWTFNNLPKSTVVPTDDAHFVNKLYVDSIPKTDRFIGTDESPVNLNELNNGIYYLEGKVRYSKDFTRTYQLNQGGFYIVSKTTMYDAISLILFHNFSSSASTNIYMIVNNIDKYNNWNGVTYDFTTFVRTMGNQSISGIKTFSTLPRSSQTPTNDNDLVNKLYVDTAISNAISTSITSALESDY